ncbi:MAG: OmpA family protein [Ignavibacteria bacterium]|jgi:outer membrane protein OmpA-like peptidoglycan-associated protein|nr:OmpA family protein [Ignavibacteria bacterium]MDH7528322.1 OmpA family protein [Ignavibacteria bacterium]
MFKKLLTFSLVFFVLVGLSQAQDKTYSPLSGYFGATLDGGLNISVVDKGNKLNFPTVRGGLEYFFSTKSEHAFGLRLLAGYNFLKFKDMTGKAARNFVYDAKLGLMYAYGTSQWLPYLSAGLNYTFYHSKKIADDNKAISVYGEGGLKYLLSDNFSLNLAAAYNFGGQDYFEGIKSGNSNDGYAIVSVGFGFTFSKDLDSDGDGVLDKYDQCPNTPKGVKVDEFGCPIDSDKDGVPDYLDKCPNTPKGVQVDKDGCPVDSDGDGVPDYLDKCPNTPAGAKVDKDGCPVDSDGDGVPDYLDKCPDTPAGVQVDKNGCPVDSDGDGVPDYLDKCPDTPAGVKVDKDGCPVKEEAYKVTVYFGFDRYDLRKEEKAKLDEAVKFMKDNPDAMFSIEGHACPIGPAAYNMKLSERRANTVYKYLVSQGIDKNRFMTKWFGETQPVTKVRKEYWKNRRVLVIELLEK